MPHFNISRARPCVVNSHNAVRVAGWTIAAIPSHMKMRPASRHFGPSRNSTSQSEVAIMNTTAGIITYVFNSTGTAATCTYNNGAPGTVTYATWTQDAYRGRLIAQQMNIVPIQVDCAFTSAAGGTVKGTASTTPNATPFTGTFTYTTP